jgi:hypothetical protein
MSVLIKGEATRLAMKGALVTKASATLPATTTQNLFTISGGLVLVTSIVGVVTTVIQAQANATKLTSAPTVGTAADLCATLDITGDEAGTLYSITGVLGDAMLGVNAGAVPDMLKPVIVPAGVIRLSCAATNTGATRWLMTYIPLETGARVVSA